MIQAIYLPLDETITPELSDFDRAMLSRVGKTKRARILRFRDAIDAKLSLYAELLVRRFACEALGCENMHLDFVTCENGKPCLSNTSDWHFNLSHTKNAIAVAFSDAEIGIDIERNDRYNAALAARFFTPQEAALAIADINGAQHRFSEIWTRKEAYIKWTGRGLAQPLASFDVLTGACASMLRTFHRNCYTVSVCSPSIDQLTQIEALTMSAFQAQCATLSPCS